jgi:hypothetical protein
VRGDEERVTYRKRGRGDEERVTYRKRGRERE